MQDEADHAAVAFLTEQEALFIDCFRQCNEAARQQLVIFAEIAAARNSTIPDNVVQFPRK